MFDLTQLNNQINMMKSETLSRYGKRVDIIIKMIDKELNFLNRNKMILDKIAVKVKTSRRKKKKIYEKLAERIQIKINSSSIKLEKMYLLKKKYIDEYKLQREILGIYDHTFIDDFYE
ncbi:MAG: hypothetical protein PWQ25_798 [Deferribacteres bacterium]|nr:hypothetical protein [Deferribacteres bacterium]